MSMLNTLKKNLTKQSKSDHYTGAPGPNPIWAGSAGTSAPTPNPTTAPYPPHPSATNSRPSVGPRGPINDSVPGNELPSSPFSSQSYQPYGTGVGSPPSSAQYPSYAQDRREPPQNQQQYHHHQHQQQHYHQHQSQPQKNFAQTYNQPNPNVGNNNAYQYNDPTSDYDLAEYEVSQIPTKPTYSAPVSHPASSSVPATSSALPPTSTGGRLSRGANSGPASAPVISPAPVAQSFNEDSYLQDDILSLDITSLAEEADRLRKQTEQDNVVKAGIRTEMLKLHTELDAARRSQSEALQQVQNLYTELQQERDACGRAANRISQLQKEKDTLKAQYDALFLQYEDIKSQKSRINEIPEVAVKLSGHLETILRKFESELAVLKSVTHPEAHASGGNSSTSNGAGETTNSQ